MKNSKGLKRASTKLWKSHIEAIIDVMLGGPYCKTHKMDPMGALLDWWGKKEKIGIKIGIKIGTSTLSITRIKWGEIFVFVSLCRWACLERRGPRFVRTREILSRTQWQRKWRRNPLFRAREEAGLITVIYLQIGGRLIGQDK